MTTDREPDSVRWQLVLRTTLLFGEERSHANREEIESVSAAIERLERIKVEAFAALQPKARL